MARFKVGDRVRVKTFSVRPSAWNSHGLMDCLMGKVSVIQDIFPATSDDPLYMVGGWALKESELEPIEIH